MNSTDSVDTCVIGAGVVGLAIARELAMKGRDVLVLEKHSRFGEGVSSRNSEVIHAGIYYPSGSLKATCCVRGKAMLYQYCVEKGISYRRIGKLIVASSVEEEAVLESIRLQALENGVDGLAFLDKKTLEKAEPFLRAELALHSPSTGIVSCAELMTAMLGDLEAAGGLLVCRTEVRQIEQVSEGFIVQCQVDNDPYAITCREVINCAGLGAQELARTIEGLDQSSVPELHLCKGNYFTMSGKNPFHHLIYPIPEAEGAGLGVHATIDVAGQLKFGPDVEYVEQEDYHVSMHKMADTYEAIRRYFPSLADNALQPAYAGIRPKIQGPGEPVRDFYIQTHEEHGIPGLVNLFGIESPGLTSSMALAETVAHQLTHLDN